MIEQRHKELMVHKRNDVKEQMVKGLLFFIFIKIIHPTGIVKKFDLKIMFFFGSTLTVNLSRSN